MQECMRRDMPNTSSPHEIKTCTIQLCNLMENGKGVSRRGKVTIRETNLVNEIEDLESAGEVINVHYNRLKPLHNNDGKKFVYRQFKKKCMP